MAMNQTTPSESAAPLPSAVTELSCSSPSQFLQPPLITSSVNQSSSEPLLVTSGTGGVNRQPVCSAEPRTKVATAKSTKSRVVKNLKNKLASVKSTHDGFLKELFFLENGGNLMDLLSWNKKPNISRDQFLKQRELEPDVTCHVPSATTIQIPLSTVSPSLHATPPKGGTALSPARSITFPASSPRPATRAHASFSSVYENSHEDIVMRARHEAEVMKAISELRKEGLWGASRLPKVREPARIKTHWDYLLEEMQWLATDFANEKKWKINAARKLSRSVAHYHKENHMQQAKSEKEEYQRLRKIASSIAKEVKHFWDSIRKIVEHKQQLILEAKRRKAMDLHLEFIVDQTAKYSDWLAQGLGNGPGSSEPSVPSAPSLRADIVDSDVVLSPPEESDHDDVSIEVEEEKQESCQGMEVEIKAEQGSEEQRKRRSPRKRDVGGNSQNKSESDVLVESEDKEYQLASCAEEMEDETTIEEEERLEGLVDHEGEVNALKEEGDLPLEELLEKYRQAFSPESDEGSSKLAMEDDDSADSVNQGEGSESEDAGEGEDGGEDVEEGGLESLIAGTSLEEASKTEAGLTNVAAAAEKFQPKGFTLDTTEVKTTVPFLLKHKLREYQHIGLDWLVAMHKRKLNGILADEMGLGKTIQTIALLAHLVCERRIWGPHLIIVPTSVLLNWEFELKKWCPSLKILTYFGSLKERKQKRIGWSKRNAFHVCITSYNIAVTDHRVFKQKRWNYLVLDEAQNIKNFKSQRWQTLLNFNSQHRLLLTGTPLQNNLMELWSLMHFLMPMVFSSHSDFKEWFSNPLSGMVEGSQEYNESIVKRLHQVLRPFLLRRLKMEVEKQMPQKYEHLVPCHLSKRQRFLYDEYMSRAKTKDSLASGNYLSVINILMQLRKVCNHPDLFEPRPIISPFRMESLHFYVPSPILTATDYDPFRHINLDDFNLRLCDYELVMDAFAAFRTRQLHTNRASFLELSSSGKESCDETGSTTHRFLEDLHVPEIDFKVQEHTLFRCKNMYEVSSRRCKRSPLYGRDLVRVVQKLTKDQPLDQQISSQYWLWTGYATCNSCHFECDSSSTFICEAVPSLERRLEELEEVIKRFLICVPPCACRPIAMYTYHPHPSQHLQTKDFDVRLEKELLSCTGILHPLATGSCFYFPERRLIQYDCGKLQTLDGLLQELKNGDHRVLLFTQMSRILDILEIFLNYHGWTYLRLDGSTPVQKRQFLMDQFNRDPRIFCFILSTRSGGLGVNLTGADTVIFYDSDWNPTMDAQAQDRCHRIGQTRDVHIYRLICVSTVEENILKKANQKRMLGDLAIEGGAFTTEFFKQASLRELFVSDSRSTLSSQQGEGATELSQKQIEELLLQAEDDGDAKAASQAKAEQVAELAEFDENFSVQQNKEIKAKHMDEETARAMSEFASIEEQLNAVEKYAMYFLEEETAEFAAEQLRLAEENIERAKKDWELSHLQALREEEEKIAEEEAIEDIPLTYDRPDLCNKICRDLDNGEDMPIWLPPTPPSEDFEELCVDAALEMNYDTQTVISPAVLAAIAPFSEEDYDVFGLRRQAIDSVPVKKASKLAKQTKEHVNVPPSLFWRRFTADTLSTKFKRLASHQKKAKTKDQFTPLLEQQPEGPEWTLNEDWILLKSINGVLEFPLSLTISVPAQIPNWSIVADITSSVGKVRRSPLQCREHLMNVVIPREDGSAKGDEHGQESRRHKSKDSSYRKSKGRKEQRTKSLVVNNSKEHTKQFSNCFDKIIQASICRKHTPKFTWDTVQKPSMHSDLLKDYGINMDNVLSPMQIAQQRADRIQAEHPRHNPVPPVQPYHGQSNVRSFPGGQFTKPSVAVDLPKVGYNLSRPGSSSAVPTSQRSNSSATTFSPSKTTTSALPAVTSAAASVSTAMATTVVKTYPTTSAGVGDLSKTLNITRNLTSQQLLLLRQSTLQQQQQQQQAITTTPSTLSVQPLSSAQSQKLTLPAGIEQLRATVASAASVIPRFAATSGSSVKGLPSTRPLQTEEVLALFKQQSMRMAASQSAQLTTKSSQVSSYLAAAKPVTTSSSGAVGQGISTSVAQSFRAQIQALASNKSPTVQTKLPLEKK